MFFMGLGYTNTPVTSDAVIVSPLDVTILDIQDAVFDTVFSSTDESLHLEDYTSLNWNFDTRLYAKFENDLYGGSVAFTEEIVESIRIKKKTPKDTVFKTIFTKNINNNEDFDINFTDYYEPVGNIAYAFVPVISGAESTAIINYIDSQFNYWFIANSETSYPIIIDGKFTLIDKYSTNVIEPMGRKKPIVVRNGCCNYAQISVGAKFIEPKSCKLDTDNSSNYRDKVHNFLKDGTVKLIKDIEGNIYMVDLHGDISQSESDYAYDGSTLLNVVDTSFELIEVGDALDVGDLYDNGFIDTDIDR